jgi:hypothetical protein
MNNDKAGGQPASKPQGSGAERGSAAGLASQSPKGGASQDQFGQSGDQGASTQSERNARPGAK